MQRQQSHPSGSFPACRHCGHEPRHIMDARRRPIGGHLMSCSCGDTGKYDTLADALTAWRQHHAPIPALPAAGQRIRLIGQGARTA